MNRPTDDNDNRIRAIVDSVIGTEDPDDLMINLILMYYYATLNIL